MRFSQPVFGTGVPRTGIALLQRDRRTPSEFPRHPRLAGHGDGFHGFGRQHRSGEFPRSFLVRDAGGSSAKGNDASATPWQLYDMESDPGQKKNIADNLGWGDLRCYGGSDHARWHLGYGNR